MYLRAWNVRVRVRARARAGVVLLLNFVVDDEREHAVEVPHEVRPVLLVQRDDHLPCHGSSRRPPRAASPGGLAKAAQRRGSHSAKPSEVCRPSRPGLSESRLAERAALAESAQPIGAHLAVGLRCVLVRAKRALRLRADRPVVPDLA
jgi:hypothetical protein